MSFPDGEGVHGDLVHTCLWCQLGNVLVLNPQATLSKPKTIPEQHSFLLVHLNFLIPFSCPCGANKKCYREGIKCRC
jgi:hypothetical protein